MSSDTASDHPGDSDAMALILSTKRDADSLFVNDDENIDEAGSRGIKKLKIDQDGKFNDPDPTPTPPPIPSGTVPGYDAFRVEGRPSLAIFHPGFGKTEQAVTETCNRFIDAYDEMMKNGFESQEIDNIVTNILQRWRSPHARYPETKPVGLLGPTGAGKSSGVNCYLSQLGAAVESDSGSRGTSVVHEYSAALLDQTEKFVVVVRYQRPEEIEKLVGKHYCSIMKYKTADTEELEDDEIKDLKEKHDTALDFFVTLLRNREEFETKDEAGEYFDDRQEDSEAEVVADLVKLISEFLESKKVKNNKEIFKAESEDELNGIFQTISGSSALGIATGQKPLAWPLVVKNEIHQDNDLLKSGLVLGDLPGVTDTNQTVVRNTRRYLKKAGTIFVFAKPNRILQDPDLENNLRECIRLGKMEDTYVIVTNIDEKRTLKDIERKNLIPEDEDELRAAEYKVQSLQTEQDRLIAEKESAKDLDAYRSLEKRIREMDIEIKNAQMNIKQVTIEIRNRNIERALRPKFRELYGSKRAPDLKILPTSNSEYQKYLTGYDPKDPPILDIKGTGIPAVRRILYSVPARGRLSTLSSMIRKRLPNIFSGIAGILTKSRLERKQDVEALILEIFSEETTLVTHAVDELKRNFKDRILQTFSTNQSRWQKQAESKLSEWQDYNSQTFAAFCRRSGKWRENKKAKEMLNWNVEIQGIYANKINGAFNALDDDVDVAEKDIIEDINNLYQKLQESLEVCEAFQGVDGQPFFDLIQNVRGKVGDEMSKLFDSFRTQVGLIRSATTLDPDGFATTIMQQTYEECMKMSSTSYAPQITYTNKRGKVKKRSGAHPARVEEIRKRFTGEGEIVGIFAAISQEAFESFDRVVTDWDRKWKQKISAGSLIVRNDFQGRFDTTEVKTEEGEEYKERLKDEVKVAMDALAAMEEELVKCEAWEKAGKALK